ncbi:MAG: DNA polymerase III subunit alpha [Deltaproteobacteria bacterium]|nr:DNA polymerase III subunit alpha [Deltaproteobacteria bacterium]MBU53000.1 DNA polymerase III subunit alpha [Deltaproteobacteria bacterium]|tara:strand:+ start:12640 stop:16173 length:3534 start_codon:yes stop_codon:yes gene_type:complete
MSKIEVIGPNEPTTPKKDFVHLHLHTTYSLLDGAQKIGDVKKPKKEYGMLNVVKEMGMSAVAVTDHGNMFGVVDFYKKATAAGIKPIIGCEAYVTAGHRKDKSTRGKTFHQLLLAKNALGYKNLCKLITIGYFEGFYYRPRLDKEVLRRHADGLIGTSSCLAGEVCQFLLRNQPEEALKAAKEYMEIFEGRYYIELQMNGIQEQMKVNPMLVKIARELKIPLVATNDVHYMTKADAEAQDVLMAIQMRKSVDDPNRLRHEVQEFYIKSPEEMYQQFAEWPEACDNTLKIADECDFELNLKDYYFPVIDTPEGIDNNDDYLEALTREGLEERLKVRMPQVPEEEREALRKEYDERLVYELGIIKSMGFSDYFLIVSDFINWAKDNGIPVGPGRGSAAGSLVAFAIRITDIDPIKHVLLFERFLNPERVSMPDIDVDFCEDRRIEVIDYVKKKYAVPDGESVAQIITFGKLKAKAVIKDVGRAFNMSFSETNAIAGLIPNVLNITLSQAIEQEPKIADLMSKDPKINKVIDISLRLEGLNRHSSIHAAGVVISDGRPLDEHLPLYRPAGTEDVVTQYDMKGVESIGLIKFDFLGLKNLTLIQNCLQMIKENHGVDVDISAIPLDDDKVFKLLTSGDTLGVFQLESSGMRNLMIRLKPSTFDDVIALVALYRPGPLESGMADSFIKRKHGEEEIDYFFPVLEPLLNMTYGVVIYQEQVMQIANVLASYSLGEADLLRRAMGKKIAEEMQRQRTRFLDGAEKNGHDAVKAADLFDKVEKFAAYGFNRSHSAAYGLIAYQTGWLKAHYYHEYLAALFTSDAGNTEKVLNFINDCRLHDVELLPPDVNESQKNFSVVDKKIRFGLSGVKNVGEGAIDSIISARKEDGPFTGLYDFCQRVDPKKVNRRVLESLVKCGAFDFCGKTRAGMFSCVEEALSFGAKVQKEKNSAQFSLFGGELAPVRPPEIPDITEWVDKQKLNLEKEALGFYISGHPLERYRSDLKRFTSSTIVNLTDKADKSEVNIAGIITARRDLTTKRGDRMAILTVEDLTGYVEVCLFPKVFQTAVDILDQDVPLLLTGDVEHDEKGATLKAKSVRSLMEARAEKANEIHLQLSTLDLSESRINELVTVMRKHPGRCRAFVHIQVPQKLQTTIKLPEEFTLDPTEAFVEDLERLFGSNPTYFK